MEQNAQFCWYTLFYSPISSLFSKSQNAVLTIFPTPFFWFSDKTKIDEKCDTPVNHSSSIPNTFRDTRRAPSRNFARRPEDLELFLIPYPWSAKNFAPEK